MRLLVVDDDPELLLLLGAVLREEGYAVDTADGGSEAATLAFVNEYDGVVLDLMLPDRGGVEVLRELRRAGRGTPVLMLTAVGEKDMIVRALDAGADDYLVKPVDLAELKARVRALVRRGGQTRSEQLRAGNVVLNRVTRQLLVGGVRAALTRKEFGVLEQLLLHAGETVSRTELLERVWENGRDPDSNVVDALVARLRAKLRDGGSTVRLTTVRGFGFMLEEGGTEGPSAEG